MPETNFYLNTNETSAYSSGGTYITNTHGLVDYAIAQTEPIGWANQETPVVYPTHERTTQIHPILYFKYVKSKFSLLERKDLKKRLNELQNAFDKALMNGQEALARKFLDEFVIKTREAAIGAKGVKFFIERDDLFKHKNSIRGGHISDTLLADYTRIIPKKVLKMKEKVQDVFDGFVIYHYWNDKIEEKDVKEMSREEKLKMRDPVLFGIIRETNRLYFIAEWDDEHCDLSFKELTSVVARGNV